MPHLAATDCRRPTTSLRRSRRRCDRSLAPGQRGATHDHRCLGSCGPNVWNVGNRDPVSEEAREEDPQKNERRVEGDPLAREEGEYGWVIHAGFDEVSKILRGV